MSSDSSSIPAPDIDLPQLERSLRSPRTLFSVILSWLTGILSVVAMVPLFSVLVMLIYRGGKALRLTLFTQLPPAAMMTGGGFGNAVVGTALMVGIAILVSVPVGILAAVFLAEFGRDGKVSSAVRFSAKVLTGMPSILAGVFAFALVVMVLGKFSALAGGVALGLLMLPTVVLTAEEAIRMVPARMREAAIGMGATNTQTVLRVTLPTAMPGILTGVMLAVARAAGETAPLLFTAQFSYFWPGHKVMEPTASMAVLIYRFSGSAYDNQVELAWAASLVLVVLVLVMNLTGQWVTSRARRP
jgi:phosphate transport system permease protein